MRKYLKDLYYNVGESSEKYWEIFEFVKKAINFNFISTFSLRLFNILEEKYSAFVGKTFWNLNYVTKKSVGIGILSVSTNNFEKILLNWSTFYIFALQMGIKKQIKMNASLGIKVLNCKIHFTASDSFAVNYVTQRCCTF